MVRRLCLAVTLALLLAGSAQAVTYIAFEQITVANTAIGLTVAKITPVGQPQPNVGYCRLELAEIRYTTDGTTPTTTVGTLLEVGEAVLLQDHDYLVRFLAIRTTAVSGQLDCTYSR